MNALLRHQAVDSSTGAPLSGAKLYTYEAGTSTPLATYSDEALTSANANPVVSDSAGYFGAIYLTPGTAYKFVLKTSAGVTIWTQDNVYGLESTLSTSLLSTALKRVATTPKDYGALGDGVADESTEVQDAIDNAAGGVVDLVGGTYRCDSQITLPADIVIQNGKLDFSNCADAACIAITGSLGGSLLLTANALGGATSVALASVSGLAAGDWILISNSLGYKEIHRIASIAALVVTLDRPLSATYNTADTAAVREIVNTDSDNITIENVEIVSNKASATVQQAVSALYATNVSVRDCVFDGVTNDGGSNAVSISYSAGVRVEDCLMLCGGASPACCGVLVENGSSNITLSKNRIENAYACIALKTCDGVSILDSEMLASGGPAVFGATASEWPTNILISRCRLRSTGAVSAVDLYAAPITIEHCDCFGESIDLDPRPQGGIYGGSVVRVINTTASELDVNSDDATSLIDYADVLGFSGDISIGDGGVSGSIGDVVLSGCRNSAVAVYWVTGDVSITGCADLSGLVVYGITGSAAIAGCVVAGSMTCEEITGYCSISGCDCTGTIDIDDVTDRVSVCGNVARNVDIEECPNIVVTGNALSKTSSSGGAVDISTVAVAFTSCIISNNSITATDGHGINVNATTSSEGLAIANNVIQHSGGSTDFLIKISGICAGIAISGNSLVRANDTDDNIHLNGTAAGNITNVVISGNYLRNGDYGVGEANDANSTNVVIIANILSSMSSGNFEGTISLALAAADHNL